MGSLASKISSAKELNRMKKDEETVKSLAQQYRERNINS